jgi:SAM-dependent methyltransferase
MMELNRDDFLRFLDRVQFRTSFWGAHFDRYMETFRAMQKVDFGDSRCERALELGTSWIFATYLQMNGLVPSVDVTDFDNPSQMKIKTVRCPLNGIDEAFRSFSLDLESNLIPVQDGYYDLILCCEVLEHMDVDPMHMMAEINRILRDNGLLLLSTPNAASSQILKRILHGYAPQFYMYYQKDRSPYRHNFEYAPHQARQLIEASGFSIVDLWTADTFSSADTEAMEILRQHGYPTDERGDNIFVIARRTGPVRDRHPNQIYDARF